MTLGSAEILVAVIDTGIAAHPELLPRLSGDSYDFLDGDSDPDGEGFWHGLHTTGTIGMATDNASGGAAVDWNARILALRAGDEDGIPDSASRNALRYAARLPNSSGQVPAEAAKIVNMSYGGPAPSPVIEATVEDLTQLGIATVAAAGNDGAQLDFYPAAFESVVAVAASEIDDTLAAYTNYGPFVDLAAPGGNVMTDKNLDNRPDGILSLWVQDSGAFGFAWAQGTSMAAPHVSGTLALMASLNPSLSVPEMHVALYASNARPRASRSRRSFRVRARRCASRGGARGPGCSSGRGDV